MRAPVARCTQNVSRLPLRLTHGWTFQSQKTLSQIFQNFVSKVFGNLFATQFNHENHVFCALRTVFKNFSFFPHSFWLFIVLSIHLSHKLTMFTMFSLKNPPFSSSSLHQSSRKCMAYGSFLKYFMFIVFYFLIFEFLLSLLNGFGWCW